MTVNGFLYSLSSTLNISNTDREEISKSIIAIKKRLADYFSKDLSDVIVFGSYARNTILPKKANENLDINIMIVFANNTEDYTPQSYLNWLKTFGTNNYSTSYVHQSKPSIVIELNNIKYEITPAITQFKYDSETYFIPSSSSEWMTTKPNISNKDLNQCDIINKSKIKPIIRLIKWWNITQNHCSIPSFQIEHLITEKMNYPHEDYTDYIDYALEAFESIKNSGNTTWVDLAVDRIITAKTYEKNEEEKKAIIEILKVFPNINR